MGKIHELLAVETDLKTKANQVRDGVTKLFGQGAALFVGQLRTYEPLNEQGEKFPPEVKPLGAQVGDQIKAVRKDFGRWIDLAISKEASNSNPAASSAVDVDGVNILPSLPVTALLNLESRLEELKKLYVAIPTNDLTDEWQYDTSNGLWKSQPTTSYRTKKVNQRFVLAEATEKFPAQVNIVTVDEREGTWTTVKTSGMLSPVQKEERLARLESLLMAVRKARQRANDVEATDVKVAEKIFAFIEGE